MVYIRTVAYNAEKTLRKTIESVLNQTYTEFEFYICDNGSTDNGATRKIIDEYAKKDNRITAFYNQKNHVWDEENDKCKNFANYLSDDDLFCQLDADDEYTCTFLQECILFMQINNLDIVCCGNDYIDVKNNKIIKTRVIDKNLIIGKNEFCDYFTEYHQFMRTIWAHLYKVKVFKGVDWNAANDNTPNAYGGDTYINFYAFEHADKVGILAKSLHKYYVSSESVSYKYNPDRIKCDQILHKRGVAFLNQFGEISKQNNIFLLAVYFNAVFDTIKIISTAQIPTLDKLKDLYKIFACEYTKEMITLNDSSYALQLKDLQTSILNWLLSDEVQSKREYKKIAIDIIIAFNDDIISLLDKDFLALLINKHKNLFMCLISHDFETAISLIQKQTPTLHFTKLEIELNCKTNLSDAEQLGNFASIKACKLKYENQLQLDKHINAILAKYPLISCLNADMAAAFHSTISLIIKGDPVSALNTFLSTEDVEVDDKDADGYFMFAQNLTALADNADAYLYFKKAWLSYLIESNRIEDAQLEINDLLLLIPLDEEVMLLKQKLQ